MAIAEGWHGLEITFADRVAPESDAIDVLSALLFELGATGIETKDEVRPVRLVAAFPPEIDAVPLPELVAVNAEAYEIPLAAVTPQTFEPIDWADHWRRHFHPLAFGRLWIVPTWLEPPAGAELVLRLDPSMAFGTGLHPTTALCIERVLALSPVDSMLDVGTGTGVLALAALVAGARRAVGTDNDPGALIVAADNAELNGLADRLELSGAAVAALGRRFPLVVANILAGPLVEMAPELAAAVAPSGRLALSGVLASQAGTVAEAYRAQGLVEEGREGRDEWVRIDLRRPS